MSAGWLHGCARTKGGEAYCWGQNHSGELGDGTNQSSSLPVKVLLDDVREIASGGDHGCAMTAAGEVYCWGDADKLGTDATRDSWRPAKVELANVTHIASGLNHTCASTAAGDILCWGDNSIGQLGRGDTPGNTKVPGAIHNRLSSVRELVARSSTTCAVTNENEAFCWGSAAYEGRGPSYYNPTPTRIAVSNVAHAAPGGSHLCVLTTAGEILCQGEGNAGQLGDGMQLGSKTMIAPLGISAANPARSVSAGGNHTCAVMSTGAVMCWGDPYNGRLGTGNTTRQTAPASASMLGGMLEVSLGVAHSCAFSAAGEAYCWGSNASGQVGDGSTEDVKAPQRIRL